MLRLFLCGDVMLGRGIDQVQRYSCAPRLYESAIDSALGYVHLAERAHGPIPRFVDPAYVWGAAIDVLTGARPQVRIVNLESTITTSEHALRKGINYRMHPGNVAVLRAAAIDCCVLANNHMLDWGEDGLCETLDVLHDAGIAVAGAGRDARAAQALAVLPAGAAGRVLVMACGAEDSGVPASWSAGAAQAGVHWLPDYSPASVERIARLVHDVKQPGDVAVASVHWGSNWGYRVQPEHRRFAHALIDQAAIDVIHGHSSHHAKGMEVYRERLILYGCGDFVNDYEGISGYEEFRGDLVLMYLPTLAPTGELLDLELMPLQLRRFQLQRTGSADRQWLLDTLDRQTRSLGTRMVRRGDGFGLDWR
jgi:poly-gamma-glutamate synthesis protein (capsule biosynthesis protein)